MRTITLSATALAVAVLACTSLEASSPKFFQASTQADFLKGDVDNVTIDSHGQLMLGPATELVYETSAPFLWSMVAAPDGTLFIGTGNEGKVLRVDQHGKAFVLLDSPFQEIRALHFDNKGLLYAAALNARNTASGSGTPTEEHAERPAPETARTPVPSVSAEITSISIVDVGGGSGGPGSTHEDRRSPRGAVYRINPGGGWDQPWESRDDSPYEVTFDPNGAVIVGTGNKGKLYRLEGDPLKPTLLARASAQQVTAFYKDTHGRLYYATANPGKLFRIAPQRAARGP